MVASFRPLSARARWMLRAALILAWASGVGGTFTSSMLLWQYRGPRPPRTTVSGPAVAPSAPASAAASEVPSAAPSEAESAAPSEAESAAPSEATGAAPSEAASAAPTEAASAAPTEAASAAPTEGEGAAPGEAASVAPTEVASAAPSQVPSAAPSVAPVAPPALSITEAEADVMMDAFEEFRSTRLPLTAANLVLSIALVVGAARTLGRRPGGLSWLRQVCVATTLFAITEYVVSRDERAYLAEHLPPVMAVRLERSGLSPEQAQERLRASVQLRFVLVLLAQIGLYGGLAIALGRPSVAFELAPERARRGSIPPSSNDDS